MKHLKLFEEYENSSDELDRVLLHFYQSKEEKQYFFHQNSNINVRLWEKENIGDYFEIKSDSLWYYTPGNKNSCVGLRGYDPSELLSAFNRRFKTNLKSIKIFDSINNRIM